jgi:hypothetical protein
MSPLVNKIIRVLANPPDDKSLQYALCDAWCLFEKSLGLPPAGWDRAVIETDITDTDIQELKLALVAFVESEGLGCSALMVLRDPSLKPLFTNVLRRHIDGDAQELYAAMMSLDYLGEDVFAGRRSRNIRDEAVNRELAVAYLKRQ